ncbi:hypothetical protein LOTGIDRAFT_155350 [Lottia gigantea]|uniref:Uncharacterized protein n=1 Tax=Lottia gigantea TaxID=225164 RepID=V3ZNI2_LOTGI|nr:hypothetical protein LOTGIDRAFT_155350 [Lottia gigantea]ESO84035.1 hypothetical protein LOTGIDRAFT_155350 [Lottia gigantea]
MIKGNCYWILFILMYLEGSNFINCLHVDTCFTSNSCGLETITCPTGTVIVPEINYLFKKATPNTCPGPAGDCDHVCCTFDSVDSDEDTNLEVPDINAILQYVVNCLKQESCNVQAPFDNTKDFDYVLYPYSCLETSKVVEIVDNTATETFNGDVSVFYSGATEATPGTNCSCQVTSTSQMTIVSIYVYLDELTCPQVKLTTDGGVNIVSCDATGYLSLEDDYDPGNQFYLELSSLNATEFNVIWIKFKTDPAADINVQCNGCSRSSTVAPPEADVPSVVATCYTDSGSCSTVSIECTTGNVIAPSVHYLVKKQTPNSCPAPAEDCSNVCCTFDEADFNDVNNELADDILSYVSECLKQDSCLFQSTYDATLSFDYNAYLYYCIPETSIVKMSDNIATTTFTGEVSIYYAAEELPFPGNNCSCVVTSATSMTIKSYYAFLDLSSCPKVIATISGTALYTCAAEGYLSFEEEFGTTNQLYIEIQNNANAATNNVMWLSASTGTGDDISVSCSGCENTPPTSSTATTTTTPTSSTSTATSAATTQITSTTTNPSTTETGTTTLTTTSSSTNTSPTSSQESAASTSNADTDNSTASNTTNLPINSGDGTGREVSDSSTGLIIGVSATLGALVLGVTVTHGILYLIHKHKNAKVSP